MKTIIYISDINMAAKPKFIEGLEKHKQYYKILIFESQESTYDNLLDTYFDKVIMVPSVFDEELLSDIIKEQKQEHDICALYAPKENLIEIGGYLRTKFGIPGIQDNQANAVRNKWIMKEMVRQRKIKTCKFIIAFSEKDYYNFIERVGYPVIVKPLSGYASINTFKISDDIELKQYIDEKRKEGQKDLLEEFIVGREFHCDSIVENGNVVFASTSQYLFNCIDIATKNMPPASITYPVKEFDNEVIRKIRELNEEVVSALGINNSVTHGEYFVTHDNEVYFGEIGARIGGGDVMPPCIENTFGVNIFEAMIDIELDKLHLNLSNGKDLFTGMICLPCKAGTIQKIAAREDFNDIDGIIKFLVFNQVGDTITNVTDTMTRTGVMIVEDKSYEALEKKLITIYRRFTDLLVTV